MVAWHSFRRSITEWRLRTSMSSSGKSIDASVRARSSFRRCESVVTSVENPPASDELASLAAVSFSAAMRSAMASACNRSILPFKNARSENSPGCALLAPRSRQRVNMLCKTMCPPWPCNSTTSSPVKEFGPGK